jgi:AhpD family alkylhydroperoxidase
MRSLGQKAPGAMSGFGDLHDKTMGNGALDSKTKELIALAIGISAHCDDCIAFHVHEALKHGASQEEIAETIGVAIVMGGGPSLMYSLHAVEAMEQFAAEGS